MKKKLMAILIAAAFTLAFAQAQPVVSFSAAAQTLKAKATVDAVSKATKKTKKKSKSTSKKKANPTPQPTMDMNGMPMTPVDNLTQAENPLYPVGAAVIINTDHMPGMMDAKGTISGAFDTTLYAVDYTDMHGMVVPNHRWVISEEIEGSADKTFQVGDTVTLGQGHMESMGGAGQSAVIAQVVQGPAYMVDYDPTDGSARVVNHQWVAEFELQSDDSAS